MSATPTSPTPISTPTEEKKRRRPELSEYERGFICGMHMSGASLNKIATTLNISRSTVQYTIKKQASREGGKTQKRSGRPHILSPDDEDHIIRLLEADHAVTYKAIRDAIQKTVSDETIRRVFKKRGLAHLREQMSPQVLKSGVKNSPKSAAVLNKPQLAATTEVLPLPALES